MNASTVIDLVVLGAALVSVVVLGLISWRQYRRDRIEAEIDRRQREVLRVAAELADELHAQGFEARRAMIRAAQAAAARHPDDR